MKKLQVIGIGNRIMGDDGIGVYIVEELIKQNFLHNIESVSVKTDISIEFTVEESDINIEYVVGETDFDYCLDCLDNQSSVIIIDSSISGNKPCTVTEFNITDMVSNNMFLCTSMLSAHNNSIIEAAIMMLNHCHFMIIGIEPEIVDFRLGLSDTLKTSFSDIVEDVKKIILKRVKQYLNK